MLAHRVEKRHRRTCLKHVVFVCTGNVCRSPMAEGLFRAMVKDRADYKVESAGVHAGSGSRASAHSMSALKEEGIDLSKFRSQPLTKKLVQSATHLFVMTEGHRAVIEMMFPNAAEKIFLLTEFTADDALRGQDVLDPIGAGKSIYASTRNLMKRVLPSVLGYIDKTTPLTLP